MDMKVGRFPEIFPAWSPESSLLDHPRNQAMLGVKSCERFEARLWYIMKS
jgi:hypothetical protein